jgi:hypothetical protein
MGFVVFTSVTRKTLRFDMIPCRLVDRHHNSLETRVHLQGVDSMYLRSSERSILSQISCNVLLHDTRRSAVRPTWHVVVSTCLGRKFLRTTFGPKRGCATRGRGKVRNVKVHDMHSSPNVIRVFKWRSMWWSRQAASIVIRRNAWRENIKRTDHLEDLGTEGRIILKFILNKRGGRMWAGFVWLNRR